MSLYSTITAFVAGICIAFGLLFLFIGLRRRHERVLSLWFALFALSYAVALLGGLGFRFAPTVEEFITTVRWDTIFVSLAFIALIWFVSEYSNVRAPSFLWAITAVFVMTGLVKLFLPEVFYGGISGLTAITLPWGEQIAEIQSVREGSGWQVLFLLGQVAVLGFLVVAIVLPYRRGQRREAAMLGIGVLWYLLSLTYEITADLRIVGYYSLTEIGFLGLAVAMSLQMSNSVIRAEELLEESRAELETRVRQRTADLNQTNQQLRHAINTLQQIEQELRRSEQQFRKIFEEGPLGMAFINPDLRFISVNATFCEIVGYTAEELRSLTFPEITHPDDIAPDIELVQQMFAGEIPSYEVEKRYFKKSGEIIWIQLTRSLIRDAEGQPLYGLSMVRDITQQRQAAEALELRVEELAILHQSAKLLGQFADLPTALQRVSELVNKLFGARYTHIVIANANQERLEQLIGFDREEDVFEPLTIDVDLGELPPIQQLFAAQVALIINDVPAHHLAPPIGTYLAERGIQSVMGIPMIVRGKAVGLVTVAADEVGRAFTAAELTLAETIVSDIAAAIENARLLEQAQAAAVARERNRLARDLHDAVTQTIYAAGLIAEALPQVWERNPQEGLRNTEKLRQLVRGALAEMRTLLFELRPAALEAAELENLLHQLSDAFSGRTHIPVDLHLRGQKELLPDVKIALYHIAQESFNNISKHARASRVSLNLNQRPQRVSLILTDNGRGFDLDSIAQDRMGVRIMQERAAAIGAALEIDSAPGHGTTVSVHWPNHGANGSDVV